jgi:type IV pilus assembly protein PilM
MLNANTFLALDFGAGTLKAAEFEVTETGTLALKGFGLKSLGAEGVQDTMREAALARSISELLAERRFSAKQVNICAPGFNVFSKFVKLPPVDTSKVTQIIQYEAQQNVPFPLEEVVWDFQILGTTPTGELEVLLVAIKADVVEGLFRTADAAGLRLQLVDVSPAALCNAFRFNYGDLDGCTMLLDIGARTSNLLFFEKGKVFSRSINIGANSITQDFANESKLSFAEAEQVKVAKGFVSLGGAYEEPDDPQAAAISKIARQVMTRLHIQVNQTIQVYRGQQGGSAPVRVFLAGGASILPYTAQFFAEKLNLPVEYFNPFRNVQIDPAVDVPELEKSAHCFGEVVGLGLRNLAHCPVELNLMPKSSIQKQQFNQKRPYFVASVFCLVLVVFAYWWFTRQLVNEKQRQLGGLQAKIDPLKQQETTLNQALRGLASAKAEADQFAVWTDERLVWPRMLTELRGLLLRTEQAARRGTSEAGLWIESISVQSSEQAAQAAPPKPENTDEPTPEMAEQPASRLGGLPDTGATNQIAYLKVICRAVNMKNLSPSANTELAFSLASALKAKDAQLKELKQRLASATKEGQPPLSDVERQAIEKQIRELEPSVFFDADGTNLSGSMQDVEETALTYTFDVTLKLKRPITL